MEKRQSRRSYGAGLLVCAALLAALVLAGCDVSGLGGVGTATPVPSGTQTAQPSATSGTGDTGDNGMQSLPQDFSVQYGWRAGSMPPPYHYEYDITVGPGAQGQLIFRPNYPSFDTVQWTEPLTITQQQVADLYNLMVKQKVLRSNWTKSNNQPVGGSTQSMSITAGGKTYDVPSALTPGDEDRAKVVYDAITALVPQETWDRLMKQREQYMADYRDKHK